MGQDLLGRGWGFPPTVDKDGRIAMAEYEERVRQSIWMILSTARGERVMRPDFGCGIHDLVFAPSNAGTIGRVTADVREALVEWEPRIDLLDVDAVADEGEPNRLLIIISYRVRTTNNQFNLVYPFYLE